MDIREIRKARLAKLAKKAEGQMLYNPLLQKPVSLQPVGPRSGGWHYYGPCPDMGVSYGLYEDDKGNKVLCMAGERVYSPFTGTEMKKCEDIPAKEIEKLSPQGAYACMACSSPFSFSDKESVVKAEKVFCTQCGSDMGEALSKFREECKGQYDVQAPVPSHDVAPMPELIPAPAELPKEEKPMPEVKDMEKPVLDSSDEDSSDEEVVEPKAEEKPVEPKVEAPVEKPVEAPAQVLPVVEKPVEAPKESTPVSKESTKESKPESVPAQVVSPLVPEAPKAEPSKESSTKEVSKESAPESVPAQILPVVEAPKESTPASKESTKESIPESVPAQVEAPKESTPESKVEPKAEEPVEPKEDEVIFEPISEIPEASLASDVNMTLYEEGKENPFWNVEVKGQPTARIYLSDQEKPEEDRAVFCSKEYAETLATAMERLGTKKILSTMKARFFANKVDASALANKIREEIKAELEKEQTEKLANLRNDFVDCLNIATSAINKNWYAEEGHPLKEALYARLEKAGVYDPIEIIEGAFEEASGSFFDALFKKTVEIMAKHPEARAELRETLVKTNVLPVEKAVASEKRMSLGEKKYL